MSEKRDNFVAIACGGTGGHLFPGMAVGEKLLERGYDVLLLVSEKEVDQISSRGASGMEIPDTSRTDRSVGERNDAVGSNRDRQLQQ